MVCFSFTAAMRPTPLSTVIQQCVALAIRDCGASEKAAAVDMDVSLSLLSEGLKGEKHLSLQRLTNLGPVFLLAFCKRVMRHLGGVALSAEEVEILRGAARTGPDRINRMTEVA